MAYLNKAMIIGNLGKDPEIRMNNMGRKMVRMAVATTMRYRDNNGEQKEQTTWHDVVGWGKSAEIIEATHVAKGDCIYIEGSITKRTFADNNGQNRTVTEISLERFQLLGNRKYQATANNQATASNEQTEAPMTGDDEDLLF